MSDGSIDFHTVITQSGGVFMGNIDMIFDNWDWLTSCSLAFKSRNIGSKDILSNANVGCSDRIILDHIQSNDGLKIVNGQSTESME